MCFQHVSYQAAHDDVIEAVSFQGCYWSVRPPAANMKVEQYSTVVG